jgi:uncharacterized protein YndB with AHSA1/START domain
MTIDDAVGTIRRTLTVHVPIERAFAIFTERFEAWWPREYTWGGEVLESIGIECREGGLCYEAGPNGFSCHWGRVLVWDPPHRLVLSWQISPERAPQPNPAKASEIELRFIAEGPRTLVEFEHRGFARHGKGGARYRAAMDSPQGWTYILQRYASEAT